MPLFSIIVVHYQGTVTHENFLRGIESLRAQTFRDFEILCYHDGPLLDASIESPVPIVCTAERHDDWGHSLRDRGIREATADYIVHFNADNILYPNALEVIAREIERPARMHDSTGAVVDTNDIVIFPIIMHGMIKFREVTVQIKDKPGFYIILTGNPPFPQYIDCMQFVMKRSNWLREGGWYDKRNLGDGFMYQKFCQTYGYRYVGPVLGEHF